jgi:hypothetical protein
MSRLYMFNRALWDIGGILFLIDWTFVCSVNLTVQFMFSNLLQHRQGSPPLPPQMRLFVAPVQSLPGKDSEDDSDDDDDLSICHDDLTQNQESQLEEDRYMNASSQAVESGADATKVGLTADLYTTNIAMPSPSPKPKGKKSRKGRTPQGIKGKRGATKRLSEDPILVDLQINGRGTKSLLELEVVSTEPQELHGHSTFTDLPSNGGGPENVSRVEEVRAPEPNELSDWSVFGGSTLVLTTVENMCTSSGISENGPCKSVTEMSLSRDEAEDRSEKVTTSGEGDSGLKAAQQELYSEDSDIEEISVDEFQIGGGRRKGSAGETTNSAESDSCSIPLSTFGGGSVCAEVREKNLLEQKSMKGAELQQKSLETLSPTRKHGLRGSVQHPQRSQ